jgi:uncharacterized membrane-anchored protein
MNGIALLFLAIAAVVEGVNFIWFKHAKVAPLIQRLHCLALFLFFSGFIMYVMFDFWLLKPVGNG